MLYLHQYFEALGLQGEKSVEADVTFTWDKETKVHVTGKFIYRPQTLSAAFALLQGLFFEDKVSLSIDKSIEVNNDLNRVDELYALLQLVYMLLVTSLYYVQCMYNLAKSTTQLFFIDRFCAEQQILQRNCCITNITKGSLLCTPGAFFNTVHIFVCRSPRQQWVF